MQPFDTLIAVDWSAASVPVKGANSIWISRRSARPGDQGRNRLTNFSTRLEAERFLSREIRRSQVEGTRLLMGFDFPFGYPEGFAERLADQAKARGLDLGDERNLWCVIWRVFSALIEDDARNANNRFAVGAELNRWLGFGEGPFWGCPRHHAGPDLSPFRPAKHILSERRMCEVPVPKSQPGWKLAYVGSVGSQGLMGIPVLQRLRQRHGVGVWPFEPVPSQGATQIFTELYLSLWPIPAMGGPCKDADQVSAMTAGWRGNQTALARWLTDPYPAAVLREEGWVLGVPSPLSNAGSLTAKGVQRDDVVTSG
ncbi:MAG: hypothetical protein CMF26_07235 [Kiloniella sp.]|nr:hypothetical protein [Kiloniella sp.]